MTTPRPGQVKDDLETPVLLVNLDLFEANMRHLAQFCHQHGKAWRPHSKAHKSPAIAQLELASGACGITCAKLSEAELMVAHGIGSILLANQIVNNAKFEKLARLQAKAEVIAALDDLEVVGPLAEAGRRLGATIPVVIELDIGMERVGAEPGEPTLAIAEAIQAQPNLAFKGLMGYEGHVLNITPAKDKEQACRHALDLLVDTRDLLQSRGIRVEIVSAGGTGSYEYTALHDGITEIQAGGGIFMDAMYRQACNVQSLAPALTVLTTVTSRSAGRIVVDAGFKTLSAYHHAPEARNREDIALRYLSAEHGVFDILPGHVGPALGERIELVVGYSDSTTFLHDHFVALRADQVEKVWEILARGLVT